MGELGFLFHFSLNRLHFKNRDTNNVDAQIRLHQWDII